MDDETFQKELARFKIVRLADHHKIRWKSQRKSEVKPRLVGNTSPRPSTDSKASETFIAENGFWGLIERINVNNLTTDEMKAFISTLKQEHAASAGSVNLHDLEYLASLVEV